MSFGRRILKGIKSRSLWNHCLLLGLVLIDLKILAIYEISLSALMLFWEQSQSLDSCCVWHQLVINTKSIAFVCPRLQERVLSHVLSWDRSSILSWSPWKFKFQPPPPPPHPKNHSSSQSRVAQSCQLWYMHAFIKGRRSLCVREGGSTALSS